MTRSIRFLFIGLTLLWSLVLMVPRPALAAFETTTADTISWFYAAAFGRTPVPNSSLPDYGDLNGLIFWTDAYLADEGSFAGEMYAMADFFASSAEFQANYPGNLSNAAFVTALYSNMLNREPDTAGFDYWVGRLNAGASRGTVLADFANSAENQDSNPARKAALESFIVFIAADANGTITPTEAGLWLAANPDLDGAIIDGGSNVLTDLYPRIDFLSDQTLLFNGIGQSANLQVRVFDAAGQEVPNAQVSWSSSTPETVAVASTGGLSAKVDTLANWSGPITLTATYAPLNLSAQALAVMATLAPETVLASSSVVTTIDGDRGAQHQIILARTAETERLQVGKILVTGDQAGVMVRILQITLEADRVILLVEPAAITEAFKDLDLVVEGEPVRVTIDATPQGATVTIRSRDGQRQLARQVLPQSSVLELLKCTRELRLGQDMSVSGLTLESILTPRAGPIVKDNELVGFIVMLEGSLGIKAGLTVTPSVNATFSGECKATLPGVPLPSVPIGVFGTGAFTLTPEIGINLTVNSGRSMVYFGSSLERKWSFKAGMRYTSTGGWESISESSVSGDSTIKTPGKNELTVKAGLFVKLRSGLSFALGRGPFSVGILDIDFLNLSGGPYVQFSLPYPTEFIEQAYAGPTAELGVEAKASAQLKYAIFEGTISKYLPFKLTFGSDWSFDVFSEQMVIWNTPKPTGSVTCIPGCSTLPTDGTGSITFKAQADTVATGRVEFWASKNGTSKLIKLAEAPFTGGQGQVTIASSVLGEAYDKDAYPIYLRLKLDDALYEFTQVLPLASEGSIGVLLIGGEDQNYVGQSEFCFSATANYGARGSCGQCATGATSATLQSTGVLTINRSRFHYEVTWDALGNCTAAGVTLRSPHLITGSAASGSLSASRNITSNDGTVLGNLVFSGSYNATSMTASGSTSYTQQLSSGRFMTVSLSDNIVLQRSTVGLEAMPTSADGLMPTLRSLINDAQASLSSPQTSADGRVIVFATDAALLPEDNNGVSDIYRFTVAKGQLQRLSLGWDGQPANAASHSPRLDASGQRVVFLSAATNLTPGLPGTADQLYLHDEQIGGLLRLSETPSGEPADAAITHPLIDAAGQQVVYRSTAHNLADGPGLYRYDLRSGLRQPIAVDEQGQPDPRADVPAADAALALIAYQRPVANGLGAESTQVYLYDPAKSAALQVSEFFDGTGQSVAGCCASVSPDGGYLAWRETTADGERRLILMERASGRRMTQPWPQVEALAEQAPVFRNDNRELWWVAPLQRPGSEPVLQRMQNPLMEAAR